MTCWFDLLHMMICTACDDCGASPPQACDCNDCVASNHPVARDNCIARRAWHSRNNFGVALKIWASLICPCMYNFFSHAYFPDFNATLVLYQCITRMDIKMSELWAGISFSARDKGIGKHLHLACLVSFLIHIQKIWNIQRIWNIHIHKMQMVTQSNCLLNWQCCNCKKGKKKVFLYPVCFSVCFVCIWYGNELLKVWILIFSV